ncbi:hypothetical protein NIES39_O07300 [Arthrospira platensis NIES-39]|nr:hypothetical protein NIES39_A04990 [Arthrospira platensis NIES-39]BAI89071.1 hypothetical protein NIES39_C02030 [Arthrospira platensis NIES-39]BAI90819.1 hypothetical protein NIES39_G00350 [Arthrospira platensis NIES-39]BAI92839.1 hypothetical protein NIES39_M00010 [Arthrospira platensis NIES-39]BAI93493.1 hypothetical protein NIES39_O02440 [Arthrospira platensis NIES-39]
MQLLQYLNPGLVNQCWFVIRGTSYRWQGISFINIDEFKGLWKNLEIPRVNNE